MGLLDSLWNCLCEETLSISCTHTWNTWIKWSDVNVSDILTKCQMARRTVAPALLSAPQLYAIDLSTVYPSFLTARAESFQLQSFISARRGPVRPSVRPAAHPNVCRKNTASDGESEELLPWSKPSNEEQIQSHSSALIQHTRILDYLLRSADGFTLHAWHSVFFYSELFFLLCVFLLIFDGL